MTEVPLTGDTGPPQYDIEHDSKTTNTPAAFGDEFVILWEMYPRKDDSAKAQKAYSAQRLAGVTAEDLLMATVNYRLHVEAQKLELRYVKYASTFFGSDEPYRDYLQPVEAPTTEPVVDPKPSRMASARAFGKSRSHWTEDKLRYQTTFQRLPPDEQDEVIAGWHDAQPSLVGAEL